MLWLHLISTHRLEMSDGIFTIVERQSSCCLSGKLMARRHRTAHFLTSRTRVTQSYKKDPNFLPSHTSNPFLQFSLNFFNLLQFASCSFFLSPILSFFLTVFLLSSFSLNRVSVSRESSARTSPVGARLG